MKSEQHFHRNHPLLAGVLEGLAAAFLLAFVFGLTMGMTAEWPLLVFVLLGYRRPMTYQATVTLPVCLFFSFFVRIPLPGIVCAVAAAMFLANLLVQSETGGRWRVEHAAFGVISFLAYGLVTLTYLDPVQVLGRLTVTALWAVSIAALIVLVRLFRRRHRAAEFENFTPSVTRALQ